MTFPHYKHKHKEEALPDPIKAVKYSQSQGRMPKSVPKNIIICYSGTLFNKIIKKYKVKKTIFYRPFYILKTPKGEIGILGNFGIGAPVTAMYLEELIVLGAKNIIAIGYAGALQKKLAPGNVVVCDKAIRDEGTSHHYLKPSKFTYSSKALTKKIEKTLQKNCISYCKGSTWTTDAPYRETYTEIKQYKKEGVITVEMEASALFAVASIRKVNAATAFIISDILGEKWDIKYHMARKQLEMLFDIAKEALLNN